VAARAKYRAVSSNKFLRLSTVPRTGAVRGSASKRRLVMMIERQIRDRERDELGLIFGVTHDEITMVIKGNK